MLPAVQSAEIPFWAQRAIATFPSLIWNARSRLVEKASNPVSSQTSLSASSKPVRSAAAAGVSTARSPAAIGVAAGPVAMTEEEELHTFWDSVNAARGSSPAPAAANDEKAKFWASFDAESAAALAAHPEEAETLAFVDRVLRAIHVASGR